MCAITGLIDFNKMSSSLILTAMTNTMKHRGPDGGHIVFQEENHFQIGLGHRRLSVIDLSENGTQPMKFEHLWICFNGEIYNHKEINSKLRQLGHDFKSDSDTETILHAYAEWGEDCLHQFIGMFAFVVYDSKAQVIFCARDRAGIKPFFYYFKNGLFLFSSELKAFHKHPNFQKEINLDAVAAFMQYGNVPAPHCIFQHCHKLFAGHSLAFSIDKKLDSLPQSRQYWSVYNAYNQPKTDISFEEAKTATEKVIATAAQYRMVADVPVGVFLSGGYDSVAITSLLQKSQTEKLKTFTIAVPDAKLNEAPYAKEIAKHLGTDHNEFECTHKEALDFIVDLPFYYDEPFGDASAIPTSLVCKIASKQVTVALSADGGDEIFAGYNRYDYLMKYGAKINKMPPFLRKSVASVMNVVPADKIPVLKNRYNFANRYEKLKGILKNPSSTQVMLSMSRQFDEKQIDKIMGNKVAALETAYLNQALKTEFYSPLAYMMAIDYQTYLLDDILQKVDRASMTSSLEGREPFLDHNVIEWAAKLPDNYKYNNGVKKHILKEIVHQHVPKEMMDRPKMGFAIPYENWMMTDLKEQVMECTNLSKIEQQGIFNPTFVRKLSNDFFSGKKELGVKMWYLMMFQMWYKKWM